MPDERLEQFRAVMLHTMNLLRELRKDTVKLRSEVAAIKVFLCSYSPDVAKELEKIQTEGETKLNSQKPSAESEFDQLLDEVIGILELNQKKKLN
jgi:hypothetical protein